ncbi:hypothetical protein A6R68_06268 [Neotoma lepida]|uniref:Uncharacterized protein n=1 Tax=Neotoma lepida TaxID=56216 RepID=A0A1A6GH45_NEOLE|nr:hypothetical protein A6R68_06268 [Neotoma lepida]
MSPSNCGAGPGPEVGTPGALDLCLGAQPFGGWRVEKLHVPQRWLLLILIYKQTLTSDTSVYKCGGDDQRPDITTVILLVLRIGSCKAIIMKNIDAGTSDCPYSCALRCSYGTNVVLHFAAVTVRGKVMRHDKIQHRPTSPNVMERGAEVSK